MSLASLPTARYTSDTATSCTRAWFSVFRSSLSWLLHKLADPRHNPVTELVSQTLTYYSRHVFPPRGFFLLVISNRQALRWILSEQRMAFSPSRNKEPDTLFQDDKLVLYTTRGCFHSPARDRGHHRDSDDRESSPGSPIRGGIREPDIRSGMCAPHRPSCTC